MAAPRQITFDDLSSLRLTANYLCHLTNSPVLYFSFSFRSSRTIYFVTHYVDAPPSEEVFTYREAFDFLNRFISDKVSSIYHKIN